MSHKIAVVVPTIRPDCWSEFLEAWTPLFTKHAVLLLKVTDGERPTVRVLAQEGNYLCGHVIDGDEYSVGEVLQNDSDLICNFSPAVRNLGFAAITKIARICGWHPDFVLTLDDDTRPHGDTIQDHIEALQMKWPVGWFHTASVRMRGFPLEVPEAQTYLSHGVWHGVPDFDAPTQMVLAKELWGSVTFPRCQIPFGSLAAICGMNIAFRYELLPYVYYAPVSQFRGSERFDDIWMGLFLKLEMDRKKLAAVSGFAAVRHERASNVFKNLQREAYGIEINEHLWKNPNSPEQLESLSAEQKEFFRSYAEKRLRWRTLVQGVDTTTA